MMRDSVPSELQTQWLGLRVLSLALTASPFVYVAVMAVVANAHSEGAQSLFSWTGVIEGEARESRGIVLAAMALMGVLGFAAAFAAHGHLLRRAPERVPEPADSAFARFRIAKIVGMAMAETISVFGLIAYILFGGFPHVVLPFLAVSLATLMAMFPTEAQLLAHLDEFGEKT